MGPMPLGEGKAEKQFVEIAKAFMRRQVKNCLEERTQIQGNGGEGLGKETVLNKFAVMSKVRTRLGSLVLKR